MRRPLRRGAWPAITALTALIATGAVPPAGASPAGPISVSTLKPSAAAATAHTVRLITGDRVVVTGSGEERQVSFVPDSDSPTGVASIVRHGDDIRVLPEEVRSLLGSGVLDSRLFEVGALIEQGYADGRDLPLIVQNTDTDAAVPEQSEQVGRLPTIRSTATRVRTEKTQKFWAGLRDTADGATAKKLADGVSRIWLDGKVTPMLDKSVPQIGAPAAWAAGYDGKGTKVAVLDTGIDATHADLADRIEEARNFSSSADAVDRHGHGTHVASTVAGSGAASGGRYKGVAPGAKLLIGKVLGDNGSGSDSSVLAGMEWAAHSGARVVSMSLGSSAPTNGTDPLSLAVNRLTAETGALFVIAAGNNGPDPVTISAPGSADAALTVAAVDGKDTIASFSSRGPRSGDVALKPDIAGPGVGIVAARGAGTAMGTPVDAHYTAASGTSMATPHVAGAATILAQRHPDWSAADLKGVLMSSAKVLPDGAFAEGSGRVDVAQAINAEVWATNASVGRFAQGATAQPVTRTVTFHNTADQAITLRLSGDLRRDGGGSPIAGALTLGADMVTLPARGSQDVQVTVAPDLAAPGGTYTGTITATGDGVTTHATVALTRDLPTYQVDVKTSMPDGTAPTSSVVSVYDLRKNSPPVSVPMNADGTLTTRVRPGRYTILGHVFKGDVGVTFVLPDVIVTDKPLNLVADGRKAALVKTVTPKPTELLSTTVFVQRQSAEQQTGVAAILGGGAGPQYVLPSDKAQDGILTSTSVQSYRSRPISARAQLRTGRADLATQFISNSARFDGRRELTVVDAGTGSAADLAAHDVSGKLALVRVGAERVRTALTRVADAGAGAIMLVSDTGFPAIAGVQLPVPAFGVSKPEGDRIAAAAAAAPVSVKLTGETTTSYTYQIVDGHKDAFPADLSLAPAQSRFADVLSKDYSPAPADAGNLYSQAGWMGQSTVTGNGASNYDFFTLGTTQHAYLLAADTKWSRLALASGYLSAPLVGGNARTYTPGSRSTQEWFKPVLHAATSSADIIPEANSQPYRTGDSMIIMIPQYATGASDIVEYGGGGAQGDKSAFRLYQGDTLLGTAPQAWVEVDNLPREKAPYRIELDSERNNRWWSVSTEQHSAWTFPSAHAEGEGRAQLPLIQADYDLEGVTLDSSVGAGRAHDLKVSFRGPDGARTVLTKARVDVSYDEGDTWRTVSSRAHKGAVSGVVKAPRGAKGISLRIHGENAAGSTIDQTVIHAVHVR